LRAPDVGGIAPRASGERKLHASGIATRPETS